MSERSGRGGGPGRAVWLRAGVAAALVGPLLAAGPAAAREPEPRYTGRALAPTSEFTGHRAMTSRAARTDPALLGRSDPGVVSVLVKLDYDSTATYAGGVAGYPATSPAVTGRRLSGDVAESRYEREYAAAQEAAFARQLDAAIPGAEIGQRLRTVYGGVSVTVPANRIGELLRFDGVAAVQRNQLRTPLTDASAAFIGATGLHPALGGASQAGAGVIVGVIDSGAWPEHPSFADQGNLKPPPGPARGCDFGDNPRTPERDVFACNNKLIGGQAFLDDYLKNIDAAERYTSARDSSGHGTHTASTAAGNVLASAPVLGVERGPIQGIAPGAWISVYKALGAQGGVDSDVTAAVQQAVRDGVDVINFSVSGGAHPFSDPAELAFLDAYAAGVFVAAAAGNSGPEAGTVHHLSPWVTTVGAATQRREFAATLSLAGGGETLRLDGASLTRGIPTATPVVRAEQVRGYAGGALCTEPARPGLFAGKIVACSRGENARVEKGYNVAAGDAVGMVLYNPTLQDVQTDNHWLPTVHLADGAEFLRFLAAHRSVTATFSGAERRDGRGDVMAAFSSRGPGGLGLKPDVVAPGVQILAGHTPTPDTVDVGPPGQLYQAIAGTSMSAPEVAGSAVLLRALHPQWTPGQVKSALMTTASTSVLKEDLKTPATPLDRGAGRIALGAASRPGLTFDETAVRMREIGDDPVASIHLNLPSVNAPVMPGRITAVRTARNVTDAEQTYDVTTTAPEGSSITVSPARFTVAPGAAAALAVTIGSSARGQQFGEITLTPRGTGLPVLHLPVAFVPQQSEIGLTQDCDRRTVAVDGVTTCTVTATNNSFGETTVALASEVSARLRIAGAAGAAPDGDRTVRREGVPLAGARPGVPSLAPVPGDDEWVPLSHFVEPLTAMENRLVNIGVPDFRYGGRAYDTIGIATDGYLVVGGGDSGDIGPAPGALPDPARPNNVLAPFWTDLDGAGAEGIRVAELTDGESGWVVVEWQMNVAGTHSGRRFQVWIGIDGVEDIVFRYDPAAPPAAPADHPYLVGAETADGLAGWRLPPGELPTRSLRVTSSAPAPGASVSYTLTVRGAEPGPATVTSTLSSPHAPGTTVVTTPLPVG